MLLLLIIIVAIKITHINFHLTSRPLPYICDKCGHGKAKDEAHSRVQ